uniref:Uncharacterized protein n=1 Tax=Meloidogyne enterolobii TaxID=390850 RepID=A0A6V7VF80_MELEN|nr:unnamed protein product [Meloidogyne enterolobii]
MKKDKFVKVGWTKPFNFEKTVYRLCRLSETRIPFRLILPKNPFTVYCLAKRFCPTLLNRLVIIM